MTFPAFLDGDHVLHDITAAAVLTESPTDAEILAALPAGAVPGNKLRHTTPLGIQYIYGIHNTGSGVTVLKETDGLTDYATLPDATLFAPDTEITVTAGGIKTLYQNNAGGTAFVEGDYEGASGGGAADGNGLIRAEGDSIPAGGHAYILNTLWRNTNGTAEPIPAGATPATMVTAGFTDSLVAVGSPDLNAGTF